MLLWLILSWSLDWQHLVSGAVIGLVCTALFGNNFIADTSRFLNPVRWFWMLVYIPVFVWEMAKANVDVAYRVLHPRMPIHPGIVRIKTRINSAMGRAVLANSITLTPGTFTVDINKDTLYIHCINVKYTEPGEAREHIAGRFENILLRIFN